MKKSSLKVQKMNKTVCDRWVSVEVSWKSFSLGGLVATTKARRSEQTYPVRVVQVEDLALRLVDVLVAAIGATNN